MCKVGGGEHFKCGHPRAPHCVNPSLLLTLQVLDDAPETVAVGGDEHSLALFDLRGDLIVPEGQSAGDRVLQALARRQLVLSQVGIATVLQESDGQCCKYRTSGRVFR